MDEDEILCSIAGSLEDDVLRQLQQQLARNNPIYSPREYEYLVLADEQARIWVSDRKSVV